MLRELAPPETGLAFEAMHALRPHLPDRDAFVARVDEVQRPEGYRLVGAFEDGTEHAAAVAGFRLVHVWPGASAPSTSTTSLRCPRTAAAGTAAR